MASPTALGAIVTRFDATVAAATTLGSAGLWVGRVPEEKDITAGPFVAVFHEGDTPDWNFENDTQGYVERTSFRFECYAVGLATLGTLVGLIKTYFDLLSPSAANTAFSITSAQALWCARQRV